MVECATIFFDPTNHSFIYPCAAIPSLYISNTVLSAKREISAHIEISAHLNAFSQSNLSGIILFSGLKIVILHSDSFEYMPASLVLQVRTPIGVRGFLRYIII